MDSDLLVFLFNVALASILGLMTENTKFGRAVPISSTRMAIFLVPVIGISEALSKHDGSVSPWPAAASFLVCLGIVLFRLWVRKSAVRKEE